MHALASGRRRCRDGATLAHQRRQRYAAKAQADVAEELAAGLEQLLFESRVHGAQFRVRVSSRLRIMLATSVYAASSAGGSSARGFDSPWAIAFFAAASSAL